MAFAHRSQPALSASFSKGSKPPRKTDRMTRFTPGAPPLRLPLQRAPPQRLPQGSTTSVRGALLERHHERLKAFSTQRYAGNAANLRCRVPTQSPTQRRTAETPRTSPPRGQSSPRQFTAPPVHPRPIPPRTKSPQTERPKGKNYASRLASRLASRPRAI